MKKARNRQTDRRAAAVVEDLIRQSVLCIRTNVSTVTQESEEQSNNVKSKAKKAISGGQRRTLNLPSDFCCSLCLRLLIIDLSIVLTESSAATYTNTSNVKGMICQILMLFCSIH
jgi:hypothetical protein